MATDHGDATASHRDRADSPGRRGGHGGRQRDAITSRVVCSIVVLICLAAISPSQTFAHAAGTCAVTPGSGSYPTISAAVTDTTCATIQVPSGAFVEQVIINRPLTLTGAGIGRTYVKFPTGATTPTTDGQALFVIWVQSTGVYVENLTVDGQETQCGSTCYSSTPYFGIDLGQGGVTVDHVSVQNVTRSIDSYANSSNGQAVTVQNSVFYQPVVSSPYGAPFDFSNNTVIGSGNGVEIGLSGGANISGNTFRHFHAPPCSNCAPGGIRAAAIGTGEGNVANNTISDSDNGIVVSDAPQTVTISGNSFSNVGTPVTLAMNRMPQVVKSNHMSSVVSGGGWPYYPGVGIAICGEARDTISGNTITGAATYGIALYAYQTAGCSNPGAGSFPTANNTISNNSISGSGANDIHDATSGSGTGGTANFYSGNTCASSQPSGLCLGSVLSGGGGSAQQPTATSAQATATGTPAATVTATTAAHPIADGHTGDGGFPMLPLVLGLVGLVGLGAGGGAFYFFRVQRVRASQEALYNQSGFLPQQSPAPWDQSSQYDERWP
jgi:parallel beta-helix repeat protein